MKQLFITISYLKYKQIYYRIYYTLRKIIYKKLHRTYSLSLSSQTQQILLSETIKSIDTFEDKQFIFLNKSHFFEKSIDWNYAIFGKLWTYNLNYFDYLHQETMTKEIGLHLMHDYIMQIEKSLDGMEAFPLSLRGMNWIKFLSYHKVNEPTIDDSLYAQYGVLMQNIEYHLLGNHLLENGFSLLFGAYYFKDERLYKKAVEILSKELDEQILEDGAHFELSPMYHQIMFFRVLDCINLLQHNSWQENTLLMVLEDKASLMLGWLSHMTYTQGEIALFNDSANKIAPTSNELFTYAHRLGIQSKDYPLGVSGYRKIKMHSYECIVDVGNIGPDYIPGHAHSDTFNFELYVAGKPFIVDTGISTYESNEKRTRERSTKAHNTVMLNGTEQTEVWGGFRVAARAKIVELVEKKEYISAIHDGYKKKFNTLHQREFFFSENNIRIVDTLHTDMLHTAVARVHFFPEITLELEGSSVFCNGIEICFSVNEIQIVKYMYAPEFNKGIEAYMIEVSFNNTLEMEIKL